MSKILGLDGKQSNQPQQVQMQINPLEHPTVACSSCGDKCFDVSFIIKKISKVAIGASTDQMMPIQIFRCASCGEILKESLPDPKLLGDE